MAVDHERGIKKHQDDLFDLELRAFMDYAGGTTSRGLRRMQVRGRR